MQSHEVLSRKYRPQKFGDVIHQDLPIRALQNAISSSRIGHAYIFFGPRGVGKTTIARIFAKRMNCEAPKENEPCNECSTCRQITSGSSSDVIEIDAASHRGIEHIRELRDNVKFAPMGGKYKVYIIDEVHMLTEASFNALLKTLEEPPEHVVFILATTEYHKIPETILSRCQDFVFKKVPLPTLQAYARKICEKESIGFDEDGLFWVAKKGDGSVRDMLSFMEQAVIFTDSSLKGKELREMLGYRGVQDLISFVQSLTDTERRGTVFQTIEQLFHEGQDLQEFIWNTVDFCQTLMLQKEHLANPETVNFPEEDLQEMGKAFAGIDKEELNYLTSQLFSLYERLRSNKLRNSVEIKIFVELELQILIDALSKPSLSGVLAKLNALSKMLGNDSGIQNDNPEPAIAKPVETRADIPKPTSPDPEPPKVAYKGMDTLVKEKFLGTEDTSGNFKTLGDD